MNGAGRVVVKKGHLDPTQSFEPGNWLPSKQGHKLSAKRAEREANEGVVIALTSSNRNNGVVLRLSCETDFVAKGESFIDFAKSIAEIALKKLPNSLDELIALDYSDGLSIQDKITEQIGVIGEKVEVKGYDKIETAAGAGQVIPYIHMGYRAGVIVALNQEGPDLVDYGKDVAMQVAAMKPVAVDKDAVPQEVIDKEIEIGKELARNEGKPEAMLEKIATGRLNKFFKETTLLNQVFVKNSKETIGSYLKSKHPELTVTEFKHISLA